MDERYGEETQNGTQVDADIVEDVKQLNAEIENFKQVIRTAEAALDSAEKDMDEILGNLPR